MAVYEGARPRSILLPRRPRRVEAPALPRRPSSARRVKYRSTAVDVALVGIVVAFVLAFFSLAQTVRVSATGYELDRLAGEQARLQARLADVESDLSRLGHDSAIRKLGLDAGLGQLRPSIILPAR